MSDKKKEKLFSLLPGKDLIFTAIRGSGPGGQNRNKNSTGILLKHPASGVQIRATDDKSQKVNKRNALHRLAENKKFKLWVNMQSAAIIQGYADIEKKMDDLMSEKNLKVEYLGD